MTDLLDLEERLLGSFDFGEDAPPAGEMLRERERWWSLAGLRERLGERDWERPRERDRERDELSERERLLDLCRGKKYIFLNKDVLGQIICNTCT